MKKRVRVSVENIICRAGREADTILYNLIAEDWRGTGGSSEYSSLLYTCRLCTNETKGFEVGLQTDESEATPDRPEAFSFMIVPHPHPTHNI